MNYIAGLLENLAARLREIPPDEGRIKIVNMIGELGVILQALCGEIRRRDI